jgi:hypothetical protein
LATGRWEIFGGAFYLFFINAAFISLSTYLIVKLLRFPVKDYINKKKQRRVARAAFFVLFLVSIPSFLFLYSVYQKNKTRQEIQSEIISVFQNQGNEILKWETVEQDSIFLIKTFFSGKQVSDAENETYNSKLQKLGLHKYRIQFFRMNLSKSEMDKMSTDMMGNIMKNIEIQNNRLMDSLQRLYRNIDEGLIFEEVRAFYPNVSALGIGSIEMKSKQKADTVWAAYLQWDTLSDQVNKDAAIISIQRYLNQRLNTDTVWMHQSSQLKKIINNE